MEATADGFRKFAQTGIVLELNRAAHVDPEMAVDGVRKPYPSQRTHP